MQKSEVIDILDKKCKETSEYLVRNCDPIFRKDEHEIVDEEAMYHKAQGLNEIYATAVNMVFNVDVQYFKNTLHNAMNEFRDIRDIRDVQKHQGRIEAMKHIIKLLDGDFTRGVKEL
tara:strand:+ start:1817 stop:2167 length:351 start_codon:yes stop_codon:yes gene_type:complete